MKNPLKQLKNLINVHDFDLEVVKGYWIGRVGPGQRFIAVVPDVQPWEIAVDILTDFMARLAEGRVPKDITEPEALMQLCVQACRRQR